MPIFRKKLTAFIRTYNIYPIKKQKNRLQYVPNMPNELYRYKQHGFTVNKKVLTAMQATLPYHGIIFFKAEQAVNAINPFNRL
jgi:hypothetical protein